MAENETGPTPETDLANWARLQLERAQQADGASRLKILDELHEVLESNLAEDQPARP